MKGYFIAGFFLLNTLFAQAQEGAGSNNAGDTVHMAYKPFEKKTTILTASFGIADWNKQGYKLPDSFKYGAGSSSIPVYIRLERAISNRISISTYLSYDAFTYTYNKVIYFNGANQYRLYSDKYSILSPGLEVFYHFNELIPVRNLDVFLGLGGTINFISHSNYPSGDSTTSKISTTFSPVIRAGARYYINRNASFFGDIGYDKMSLLSLGFSYRFIASGKK